MTQRPTPEELQNSFEFKLIDVFHIDEMGAFLAREMNTRFDENNTQKSSTRYLPLLMFVILGALVGYGLVSIIPSAFRGEWHGLSSLFGGVLLFFILLLPLHELIHGAVFKIFGAPKIGFGWNWKGMMAYAYAQKFAINLKELIWLAIMPFAIITPLLIVSVFLFPHWQFTTILLLALHTMGCIGDFMLIKYALRNKHREIYTYDDIEGKGETYFYEKVSIK
ncbi:DUF3267 domain-containing protein [Flectobacillus sp. DC10W]|uniref:DUF3267 domain-containing protein n=1 Tax=Flectobacillus longus TaxID=2984207 RepID=A0ABT6YMJ9_9BACT|nr:DUF3267 domain-containing protein [Flectobacillus longus]MDI9864687.1 DUF3267 domain-containing protein [Flectobacillus longus]